jgi:hypothetical protein
MTKIISAQAIIFLSAYIISGVGFGWFVKTPEDFVAFDFVWRAMLIMIMGLILSLFMRKSHKFPFCFSRRAESSSHSSAEGATEDGAKDLSLDILESKEANKGVTDLPDEPEN